MVSTNLDVANASGTLESAARAAGFHRFELAATLPGVKLYPRRGYSEIARIEERLANGEAVPVVRMIKE